MKIVKTIEEYRKLSIVNEQPIDKAFKKVLLGEALTREEKNLLTLLANTNDITRYGVMRGKVIYYLGDVLKRYMVNQYGEWYNVTGIDKTAVRSYLKRGVRQIVEDKRRVVIKLK